MSGDKAKGTHALFDKLIQENLKHGHIKALALRGDEISIEFKSDGELTDPIMTYEGPLEIAAAIRERIRRQYETTAFRDYLNIIAQMGDAELADLIDNLRDNASQA